MKDDLVILIKRKELERIAELKKHDAEAAKRAEEAAKRQEEKRESEEERNEAEDKLKLEAQASQADIFASFNQTAAAAGYHIQKVTKKIKVNNAKGFLEAYQMWFMAKVLHYLLQSLKRFIRRCSLTARRKLTRMMSLSSQFSLSMLTK